MASPTAADDLAQLSRLVDRIAAAVAGDSVPDVVALLSAAAADPAAAGSHASAALAPSPMPSARSGVDSQTDVGASVREALELLAHPVNGVTGSVERTLAQRRQLDAKLAAAESVIASLERLEAAHEALLRVDAALDGDGARDDGGQQPPPKRSPLSRLLHATAELDAAREAIAAADAERRRGAPQPAVIDSLWAAHARRAAALQHRSGAVLERALGAAVKCDRQPQQQPQPGGGGSDVIVASLSLHMDRSKMGALWAAAATLRQTDHAVGVLARTLRLEVVDELLAARTRGIELRVVATKAAVDAAAAGGGGKGVPLAQLLLQQAAAVASAADGSDNLASLARLFVQLVDAVAFVREHAFGLPPPAKYHAPPSLSTDGDGSSPAASPSQAAFAALGEQLWGGSDGLAAALTALLEDARPVVPPMELNGSASGAAAFQPALHHFLRYRAGPLAAAAAAESRLRSLGFLPPPSAAFADLLRDCHAEFAYRWREAVLEHAMAALAPAATRSLLAVPTTLGGKAVDASASATGGGHTLAGTLKAMLTGSSLHDPRGHYFPMPDSGVAAAPLSLSPPGVEDAVSRLVSLLTAPVATPSDGSSPPAASTAADFYTLAVELPQCTVTMAAVALSQLTRAASTAAVAAAALADEVASSSSGGGGDEDGTAAAAAAAAVGHVARVLHGTARDVLCLYPALVGPLLQAAGGSDEGGSDDAAALPPRAVALYHNDCLLLAHTGVRLSASLAGLAPAVSGVLSAPHAALTGPSFVDLLPHLRASATGALVRQLRAHRRALLGLVPRFGTRPSRTVDDYDDDEDGGGGNRRATPAAGDTWVDQDVFDDEYGHHPHGETSQDGGGSARPRLAPAHLEGAVRGQAHALRQLARAWAGAADDAGGSGGCASPVLPRVTAARALGHLADACLRRSSCDVLALRHISEPASRGLAHLLRCQGGLVAVVADALGLPPAGADALALVPHGRRHAAVAELLDAPLSAIANRVADGGYAGVLAPGEVSHAVEALFQHSPQRAAVLRALALQAGTPSLQSASSSGSAWQW